MKNTTDQLGLKIGVKVFVVKPMKKTQNKNYIVNKPQNIKSKLQRSLKIRIPCIVTNIEALDRHHVKIRISGKPTAELILNQEYDVCISNLAIAKSDRSWQMVVNG